MNLLGLVFLISCIVLGGVALHFSILVMSFIKNKEESFDDYVERLDDEYDYYDEVLEDVYYKVV